MLNFPILKRLDITGYGLYPGAAKSEPGLHVDFRPGLTLVLGANGLGKSTLVGILFRLLTGPFDIPGLANRTDLGNISLTPTRLFPSLRGTFGHRVQDGARDSSARLSFSLGDREVSVSRRLSDLALTAFAIDGEQLGTSEEQHFQPAILRLVGVWSFGDWILLLRHLVFYFEDRRALVWDPSAQRQILRFLFLAPDVAQKWAQDEHEILQLDSGMRNLSAATTREERVLARTELRVEQGVDLRTELQTLEKLQAIDETQRETLEDQVVEIESERQQARLRFLKAEQEHEARFRELERARLTSIGTRFPNQSETARYIFAQLLTENQCIVCGHTAPDAATSYIARIAARQCVVCGSDVSNDDGAEPALFADKRVDKVTEDLAAAERDLSDSRRTLDDADGQYRAHFVAIQGINTKLAERSARIDSLVKRLPPAEAALHRQRADLATMRTRVVELRQELLSKRQVFRTFVDDMNRTLATQSDAVRKSFDDFAEGFLLEICRLVWSPHKARLGETGELFDFPAFELELSGTDFLTPVRRTGPDQVSESQREFIDLAFRMSLIATAGARGAGTIVIDAPESSLDAVFVARAADVLSRFADPSRESRLIVTTNLTEGGLIRSLLDKAAPPAERDSRVLDLFAVARPTAAIRQLHDEYASVRAAMLGTNGGQA